MLNAPIAFTHYYTKFATPFEEQTMPSLLCDYFQNRTHNFSDRAHGSVTVRIFSGTAVPDPSVSLVCLILVVRHESYIQKNGISLTHITPFYMIVVNGVNLNVRHAQSGSRSLFQNRIAYGRDASRRNTTKFT